MLIIKCHQAISTCTNIPQIPLSYPIFFNRDKYGRKVKYSTANADDSTSSFASLYVALLPQSCAGVSTLCGQNRRYLSTSLIKKSICLHMYTGSKKLNVILNLDFTLSY